MAGKITTNSVVLGDSLTDTQNFVLKTNADGTATLARGALGGLGTVFGVNGSGALTGASLVSPTITGATITVAATAAPAFSAYKATNQSITSGVATKMIMDTEEFDTNSNFDSTTNYRFTPTVAGYYTVIAQINPAGTTTLTGALIYKNGASVKANSITTSNAGLNVNAIISMNGSTDYLEFYGQLVGASPATQGGSIYTFFSAAMIRSA